MIEKVNPSHPDKIADRIAGAIVDLAYAVAQNPIVAAEVLIGHGLCTVIVETNVDFEHEHIQQVVHSIAGQVQTHIVLVPQDTHLAENQRYGLRCGDNGIFKGAVLTDEQKRLSQIARDLYQKFPSDGKYILDAEKLVICQSGASTQELKALYPQAVINPLGDWQGGYNVDTGATNRKLGSDMADGVTGGGLHGKDLSKADVSVNIYAFCKAQSTGQQVEFSCAIGDEYVDGKPYWQIVEFAREYINEVGGFEEFAKWGLF